MPRARYGELAEARTRGLQAAFRKTSQPPPGYTANTVVTEWLTLNCRGLWASFSDGAFVRVRFVDRDDYARAVAHFEADPTAAAAAPRPLRDG